MTTPTNTTHHVQVFSMGAFSPDGGLMGMIVGELQPLTSLESEAGAVLESATADTTVMYIISLGGWHVHVPSVCLGGWVARIVSVGSHQLY